MVPGKNEKTGRSRVNVPALVSILVSVLLMGIAVVRMLSYTRTGDVGIWVRGSFLGFLAYDPDSFVSSRFFKVLATPSIVGMQYFIFRLLNWSHRRTIVDPEIQVDRSLDFKSPWLRLVLTSVVSLHWVLIEWAKFTVEDFYPYSPLENPGGNALVLLASQALAFWGMKYLSFEPLWKSGA